MVKTRILRAVSGVRPLVASDDDPVDVTLAVASCCSTMLNAMACVAFITITGGKLIDLSADG